MFTLRVVLLACLTLALGIGTARAQTPSDDDEAHLRFEAGRAAYAHGRYEDALEDFQRAFELSQRYELFYNLGLAYDHLRRDDEAIESFTHFLESAPADAPNREEVTRRIAVIREAQARHTEATPEPEPEPQPAPVPAATSSDPTGWILVGAGGAVLIAGAIMTVIGFGDQSSVENAPTTAMWAQIRDAYNQAPILEGVGIAALVVGAAVASVGLAIALSSSSSSSPSSLRFGPASLSLQGTF